MNKLISRIALLLSVSVIFAACDKSDDTIDPATSLEQTCWKGTLSKQAETTSVTLFFEDATHGSYESSDSKSDFRYEQDRRIIDITGYPLPISVSGKWWIDSRTATSMYLLAYPMTEDNANSTITLQKIYQ